jgi:hypothetical protein
MTVTRCIYKVEKQQKLEVQNSTTYSEEDADHRYAGLDALIP